MNKKLIVALDFDSAELALNFLENLDPQKCLVKVGLELFISEGWKVLDLISEKGFEIFLDLKLHDIPNTVANSVRKISNFNVALTTIHLNGGKDMIEAASSEKRNIKILGVSILTSLSENDNFEIKALAVSGQLLHKEQIDVLAKLPTRDQALGMLANIMLAPITKFVRTLNEVPTKTVRVLAAIKTHKESEI